MAKRTETERFKYRIIVFYREEDEGYIARIPELPGCSAFGKTPEEAAKEVRKAAGLWIKAARKMGQEIPRPVDEKKYSGKFALRLPPSLQMELDFDAKEEGISLNQLITYKLAHEKGIEIPKRAASRGSSKKSMTRKNGRPIVAQWAVRWDIGKEDIWQAIGVSTIDDMILEEIIKLDQTC